MTRQRTDFSPDEIARHAERMSPRFVQVLELATTAPYEQIATIVGIGVGTVKSRLFRARAELARLIEEDGR